MSDEPEVNSRLKRIITNRREVITANWEAHEEFVNKMAEHPHLSRDIAPDALGRWYNAAKGALDLPREERILREFGPAVSTMLER